MESAVLSLSTQFYMTIRCRKKRFKLWKIKGIDLEGSLAGKGEL